MAAGFADPSSDLNTRAVPSLERCGRCMERAAAEVSRRGVPPVDATTHSTPMFSTSYGEIGSSEPNTMNFPSGDHAGLEPNVVMRRADSPVAPTTKIPTPVLAYAISLPSGEYEGQTSSAVESPATSVGLRPPTRCT